MLSLEIIVSGIVQGVGFRPFIKRIAVKSGVKGYVKNLGGGEVIIRIEGSRESIKNFFKLFQDEKPKPAEIIYMKTLKKEVEGFKSFDILKSSSKLIKLSIIPPDIGICEDCIREIESTSRWNNYPFNSCAWCGPRFSMMYKSPYDRENTSMNDFPLCPKCTHEYRDINNIRRFHAQGISCPECGPKIWLTANNGDKIECSDPIKKAAELISEGYIIAIKGIGGFHIACRADSDDIVLTLRKRKRRPEKPFAIMARDLNVVEKLAYISKIESELLTSPQRPIVLLRSKEDAPLSKYIAPGLNNIGIMLPYSGIHYLLLKHFKPGYMIMTSGNYYNKPMERDNKTALDRLNQIVDYFLLHNREIVNRVDDSVIRTTMGKPVFLRRGRGYAPRWLITPYNLDRPVIAFGAELQNVGAIGVENKIIPTQFIGDTDEFENLMELERYLKWFIGVYGIDIKNAILVADKHPKYNSRLLAEKWADKYGIRLFEVQHHCAHANAILCEFKVSNGIVITMDGAGYGDDGAIWGGEILNIAEDRYERIGHLQYHVMPGGDLATYYPIRMLISILASEYKFEKVISELQAIGLDRHVKTENELEIIKFLLRQGKPLTSSTGRLLDAVATLLKICSYRTYEGEPAMKLEAYSEDGSLIEELLKPIFYGSKPTIIRSSHIVKMILENLDNYDHKDLAYTLQYYVGYSLGKVAAKEADRLGHNYIYVSGGAAVNNFIVKGITDALGEFNIKLRMHRELPPGDGCISTGQIYYISRILNSALS